VNKNDSRNKTANFEQMNNTTDLGRKDSGGLLSGRDKNMRNAHSLPRMGGTAFAGRRGSQSRLQPKNTFGIIPTLAPVNKQN